MCQLSTSFDGLGSQDFFIRFGSGIDFFFNTSQCHDTVALLDDMAFQALQVVALIISPEANPDNDIVHRAVGGAIVPAARDNGLRAKKFRATLIIILGGCFCRCVQWDTLESVTDISLMAERH